MAHRDAVGRGVHSIAYVPVDWLQNYTAHQGPRVAGTVLRDTWRIVHREGHGGGEGEFGEDRCVNGGVKMYRRGGVKMYCGLGGSLSP